VIRATWKRFGLLMIALWLALGITVIGLVTKHMPRRAAGFVSFGFVVTFMTASTWIILKTRIPTPTPGTPLSAYDRKRLKILIWLYRIVIAYSLIGIPIVAWKHRDQSINMRVVGILVGLIWPSIFIVALRNSQRKLNSST